MSIEKDYGEYYIVCDKCVQASDEYFTSWEEAKDAKKVIGYKSKKQDGEWADVCKSCQKESTK